LGSGDSGSSSNANDGGRPAPLVVKLKSCAWLGSASLTIERMPVPGCMVGVTVGGL
jgi:hypothetical protein